MELTRDEALNEQVEEVTLALLELPKYLRVPALERCALDPSVERRVRSLIEPYARYEKSRSEATTVIDSSLDDDPTDGRFRRARDVPSMIGRYHLIRHIGAGGFGDVFQARVDGEEAFYALKVLRPERVDDARSIQRFGKEMDYCRDLDHPSVVRYIESGLAGEHLYLVTEWVDGPDFSKVLDAVGPFGVDRLVRWGLQIARGIEHAHVSEKKIVHRDLKPGNVILDLVSDRALVLDFGLAKAIKDSGTTLTATGQIVGTMAYMAPEMADFERTPDTRTDVYGFGATMYACLTGQPPVESSLKGFALLQCLLETPPVSICEFRNDVPEWLEALVLRCLAKEREDRYPSMTAVIREMESRAPGIS